MLVIKYFFQLVARVGEGPTALPRARVETPGESRGGAVFREVNATHAPPREMRLIKISKVGII